MAQPCSGSPCPLRLQGRWLPAQGHLRAAYPVGAICQARVQTGAKKPTGWWGRPAMTSLWGQGSWTPGRLSQERLGLWGLASVWVVS